MSFPFRILLALVRFTPVDLGRRLGAMIGGLAFVVAGGLRKRSLESLTVAFGDEMAAGEIRRLARRSLAELGMTMFEFLKLPSLSNREILELIPLEGEEHVAPLIGKPAIYLSGHLGNVVMLGAAMTLRGHRVSTVVRPFTSSDLRALVFRISERLGLGVIERRGNRVGMQCLEVLRRGEILGLVADQDAGRKGVFVDFFGRPASTFLGPVQLGRGMPAPVPVVPMFCVRRADGALRAFVEPPLELVATGDAEEDDRVNTQAHAKLLERVVRASPASYLWIHRRWKTPPPEPE